MNMTIAKNMPGGRRAAEREPGLLAGKVEGPGYIGHRAGGAPKGDRGGGQWTRAPAGRFPHASQRLLGINSEENRRPS